MLSTIPSMAAAIARSSVTFASKRMVTIQVSRATATLVTPSISRACVTNCDAQELHMSSCTWNVTSRSSACTAATAGPGCAEVVVPAWPHASSSAATAGMSLRIRTD